MRHNRLGGQPATRLRWFPIDTLDQYSHENGQHPYPFVHFASALLRTLCYKKRIAFPFTYLGVHIYKIDRNERHVIKLHTVRLRSSQILPESVYCRQSLHLYKKSALPGLPIQTLGWYFDRIPNTRVCTLQSRREWRK